MSFVRKALLCALLLGAACQAHAFCYAEAAKQYGVNEDLLRAIAQVESGGNPNAVNYNRNGTRDVGLFQINSTHFNYLSAYGITEDKLFKNPCLNAKVGAWVLASNINRMGNNWDAIGAYNAGSAPGKGYLRLSYAAKVYKALQQIQTKNINLKVAMR